MKRYQIDPRRITPDKEADYFSVCLAWSSRHADRFVMGVDPGVYEDPATGQALLALGERASAPRSTGDHTVAVRGQVSDELVRELSHRLTPPSIVEGTGSPVDYLIMLDGDRAVYTVYDYGSGQTVDVSAEELSELQNLLADRGLRSDVFLPVKPV